MAKTFKADNSITYSHKENVKSISKLQKANRKLSQKLKNRKLEIDKETGWNLAKDLIKEGKELKEKKDAEKIKYDAAVAAGKIKPKKKHKKRVK